MAKCIGFLTDWTPKITESRTDLNLAEDTREGERFLREKLKDVASAVLDIASDFVLIKQTIDANGLKLSCSEVRDNLITTLRRLNLDTYQLAHNLCSSKITLFEKQKYFILYSCGVVAQLQQLLQIVGRLSELEQKIYLEEQQNPFISDQSTVIHVLTSIWTASLQIMNNFQTPGKIIFAEEESDLDEYNFSNQMEFTTAFHHYTKVFMMDLIITSWIQFNRLVKFDDLIKGLPLLCPCHSRIFFTTLRLLAEEDRHKILSELLPLIVDYKSRPSLVTESLRQHNIVPLEPCYSLSDQQSLAYFVVWNIYALSRVVKPVDKPLIRNCKTILECSYTVAMKQFEAIISQPGIQLSPHQEERHKLLTHMKFSLDQSEVNDHPAI